MVLLTVYVVLLITYIIGVIIELRFVFGIPFSDFLYMMNEGEFVLGIEDVVYFIFLISLSTSLYIYFAIDKKKTKQLIEDINSVED